MTHEKGKIKMENKYEIPGLERNSATMRLFRALNIFRPADPALVSQVKEEIRPDVLTHALQALDSGVMLGITDPEERDAIIYSIVSPKLDSIEQAIDDKMNKRRFL